MPARAAALCTRLLSTGKTCAQPALRGEPFCRFHNDARARAIAEHDERIFALSDELDAMTISQLLETVHDKLSNITSVLRTYPRPSSPSSSSSSASPNSPRRASPSPEPRAADPYPPCPNLRHHPKSNQ